MTLQQLRYLIKIVQTGSINLAAQELFLAQPSLSKAMSELEIRAENQGCMKNFQVQASSQTRSAMRRMRRSFAHWSSSVRRLPSSVEENRTAG